MTTKPVRHVVVLIHMRNDALREVRLFETIEAASVAYREALKEQGADDLLGLSDLKSLTHEGMRVASAVGLDWLEARRLPVEG